MSSTTAWLAAFGDERATADEKPLRDRCGRTLLLLEAPRDWSPAMAQSDTCRVIFDGVLHNRDELRTRFASRLPSNSSEADLVALAYREWGTDALLHLKGMFALLIWDRERARLLCARDRVGLHPLFYAGAGRSLLLSPSVEALLRHPDVSAELNRPALVDHLARRWLSNHDTYFAQVKRVLPCHVLQIEGDLRREYRYWDPAPPGSVEWVPDHEAQGRFDALLAQAVSRCLAIGPSAVNLSGGIDSSSVAMVAADLARTEGHDKPLAISLVMPGPHVDEAAAQQAVATALDMPHLQVLLSDAVGPEGAFLGALEMSRTMPAPSMTLLRLPLFRMAVEASQRGRRVILSGDGADEWVAVNPHFAADLLRMGNIRGTYQLWRTLTRSYPFPVEIPLRGMFWRWGARPLLRDALLASRFPVIARRIAPSVFHKMRRERMSRTKPSWIAADAALSAEIDRREAEEWERRQTFPQTGSHSLRFARSMLELPQKLLFHEETFALSRRAGVRVTPPFWDSDLIELLMKIRPRVRMHDGFTKSLLRTPLLRRLPALGFEGRLKSYTGNVILSAIVEGARAARNRMGPVSALGELGIVNAKEVDGFLDRAMASNDHQNWLRLWEILTLEGWVRERRSRGATTTRR